MALLSGALPVRAEEAGEVAEPEPLVLPLFGESSVDVTSTTSARFRGDNYDANDNDDQFLSIAQRLDGVLQGENLRLDLRVDGFTPVFTLDGRLAGTPGNTTSLFARDCGTHEAQCYLKPMAALERVLVRWDHDDLTLEVGDAYAVLGRGLALTFRKADLLGVDNSLQGLHLRSDDGTTSFSVHAGVANPQNTDPTNLALVRNPLDLVAGGDFARKLGEDGAWDLGAHVVALRFENLAADTTEWDRDLVVGGLRLAAPALRDGTLGVYVEGDVLRRTHRTDGQPAELGHAIYASAQHQGEQLTVLGELVDYSNYAVARDGLEGLASRIYSALPILDQDGLQRVHAPGNRRGVGVKADYALGADSPWAVSLNGLAYGLHVVPTEDPFDGVLVTHAWGGIKRFNRSKSKDPNATAWTLAALAGARRESYLTDPGITGRHVWDADRQLVHGEISGSIAKGLHSLEAKFDHRREIELDEFEGYRTIVQGGFTMTYSRGMKFSVSPIVRWSTQRVDIVRQRELKNPAVAFLGPSVFPALEGRWNFSAGNFVSIFAGAIPGGLICSGGVCRDVQAFEGLLAQLVLRL